MNPVYITVVVMAPDKVGDMPVFLHQRTTEATTTFCTQIGVPALAVLTFRVHPIEGARLVSGFIRDHENTDRMTLTVPYKWRELIHAELLVAYGDWLTKVLREKEDAKKHPGEPPLGWRPDELGVGSIPPWADERDA